MCLGSLVSLAGNYTKTLRLDYIFTGTNKETEISLAKMKSLEGWAGRHVNMDKIPRMAEFRRGHKGAKVL